LPRRPVCQAVIEAVNPSGDTVYQLMKELRASTSPPTQASPSPDARSAPGGNPGLGRSRLDPKGGLDLFPDREHEHDRHEQEDAEQHEKADAGAAELLAVLDTGTAARPGVGNGARNRRGVDRRLFGRWALGGRGADKSGIVAAPPDCCKEIRSGPERWTKP